MPEILAWARVNGETEYHPTSSCKMGIGDDAVVDGQLKVHGIDALRVVDASIMPGYRNREYSCRDPDDRRESCRSDYRQPAACAVASAPLWPLIPQWHTLSN